jgi:plastocyanin
MLKNRVAFALVIAGAILVACTSHSGGNLIPSNTSVTLPGFGNDLVATATLPKNTVGEELPSAGLGTYSSPYWKATVGGFTQSQYSQTLGFLPGTKITLRNLSPTTGHTLNVLAAAKNPPANFPANPALLSSPAGHGILEPGYRSGEVQPGKSVTIVLSKAGTYLIGCAFHYHDGMRDIFVVATNAKPGKEATPPPRATPSTGPSPTGYGY